MRNSVFCYRTGTEMQAKKTFVSLEPENQVKLLKAIAIRNWSKTSDKNLDILEMKYLHKEALHTEII